MSDNNNDNIDNNENIEKVDTTINFYSAGDQYGCFSNFSRHKIHYANETWPTSEHYFQAMKFVGTPRYYEILRAATPGDSAKLGRSRATPLRADWEDVKDGIMYDIVLAKFQQNKDIQKVLLETGDAFLVEHTFKDSYWGDGGDGTGRNQLGKTLVQVREAIRKELENK